MSDTVLAGIIAGVVAFLTAWLKSLYDAYKIKRDADLAEKKLMADAEVAAEKLREDAILSARKLEGERTDKANEWLDKIMKDQETRMDLERKRFSDTVVRLETDISGLRRELYEERKRNDECEKSNQFLKERCDLLERKHLNLERRAGENQERITDLEKKSENGGHKT